MASTNFQSRIPSSSSSSSSSSKYIPLHKTQLHPRMLSPPIPNPTKSRHNNKPLLLIICLSLLPFLLYLLSLYHSLHLPSPATFGLVIEIAHSSSQIRVFRSLNEVSGTPFSGESSDSKWVRTGTSWAGPEEVSRAVLKLVEFAMEKVPSSEWKVTKVQVMVTAAGVDDRILEECRRILRSSVFLFRDYWASVLGGGFIILNGVKRFAILLGSDYNGLNQNESLNHTHFFITVKSHMVVVIRIKSLTETANDHRVRLYTSDLPIPHWREPLLRKHWGQDEGLYNWVAVNYALGYIGNKSHETAGVIVLGRSAMQVSYASSESPASKFSKSYKIARRFLQSLCSKPEAVWSGRSLEIAA